MQRPSGKDQPGHVGGTVEGGGRMRSELLVEKMSHVAWGEQTAGTGWGPGSREEPETRFISCRGPQALWI